jgi:glycosidase
MVLLPHRGACSLVACVWALGCSSASSTPDQAQPTEAGSEADVSTAETKQEASNADLADGTPAESNEERPLDASSDALLDAGAHDAAGDGEAATPTGPLAWNDHIIYVLIPAKFDDADPNNDYMKTQYGLPSASYQGGFLGGDIAGIRRRVGYLKGLGINAVLVYPMFKNDQQPFFQFLATGYRPTDWQTVDRNFGTLQDLKDLIGELHATSDGGSLRVILDLPIGMTGLEHPWFTAQASYPNYYRPWSTENVGTQSIPTSYGPVDNGYALPIINHTLGIGTASGPYPYLRDQVIYWLVDQLGIDGFRYDSVQNFYPEFWSALMGEFRSRYAKTRPDFTHLGEVFPSLPLKSWQLAPNAYVNEQPPSRVGRIAMDGIYDGAMIGSIQAAFAKGGDLSQLVASYTQTNQQYEHPERLAASVDVYEDGSFIKAVNSGFAKQKLGLALTFLLTIDRVPLLYSGNEYGIDYTLPGALFAAGLDDTFHAWFKRLVKTRASRAELRRGDVVWLDTKPTSLVYTRSLGGVRAVIALNASATGTTLSLARAGVLSDCGALDNLLEGGGATGAISPSAIDITLAPWEARVLGCR